MDSIFKVGDVVRVRDLREIEGKYGAEIPFHTDSGMKNMIGGVHIISKVKNDVYDVERFKHLKDLCPDGCRYSLVGDKGGWAWSSPMLELVARAESLCMLTKEMVESSISSYKKALEYTNALLYFKIPTTTQCDEKKLELKVKSVRKVKLNFKN